MVRSLSAGQQDIDTARQVKRLLRAKRYQQAETRLLEFMEEHPTAVNSGELLSSLWLSQHRMEEVRVLLEELRAKFGLTYLFIGHDLSVVRHLCD